MPRPEPPPSEDPTQIAPETTARLLRSRLADAPLELPVSGESMGSTITSGSIVRITELSQPRRGEVWAFVGSGEIVVHRVRHLTEDSMTGRGDGNPLDDRTVPRSHLIGRVESTVAPDGSVRSFGWFDRRRAAVRLYVRGVARRAVRTLTGPFESSGGRRSDHIR